MDDWRDTRDKDSAFRQGTLPTVETYVVAPSVNPDVGKAGSVSTDLLGREYETFLVSEPPQQYDPVRVIVMCNQESGVGRTTSPVNVVSALVQCDHRMFIVDFDPQDTATARLDVNANTVENTICTALSDTSADPHDVVQYTTFKSIDVTPANTDLSVAKIQLVTGVGRKQIPSSVLRKLKLEHDLIIADCQPSLDLFIVNTLAAADGVIIPVAAEFFALYGAALFIQPIEKVQSHINPALEVGGVLITMYIEVLHCEEVCQRVYETFSEKVFHTFISRSIKLPDSTVVAASVMVYAPGHKMLEEYRGVVRELTARGIIT